MNTNFLLVYKPKHPNHFASKPLTYGEDFTYQAEAISLTGSRSNVHRAFLEPNTRVSLDKYQLVPCLLKTGKFVFDLFGVVVSWGLSDSTSDSPTRRGYVDVRLFNDTLNAIEFSESNRLVEEKKEEAQFKKFVKSLPW